MKIITRTAAAAVVLSLPLALGACGGDGDKPSKADVKAGYIKGLKKEVGKDASTVPDSLYTKMADCIFDKSYDKVSAGTLKKLTSGDFDKDTKIKSEDEKELSSASDKCEETVKP